MVVIDGKIDDRRSREEQIERGVEGYTVSSRFGSKTTLDNPLNIFGDENNLFERTVREFEELSQRDLFEFMAADDSSFNDAMNALSQTREDNLLNKKTGRMDSAITRQIIRDKLFELMPEEKRLEMLAEDRERFFSEEDPQKRYSIADSLCKSTTPDIAKACLVYADIWDMEPSEREAYFEENPDKRKYGSESYMQRIELLYKAREYKDVCNLWVAYMNRNFQASNNIADKNALEIIYYHFMKTEDSEVRGRCLALINKIFPEAKGLFIPSPDGKVTINGEELLKQYNALGGEPVQDLVELFSKGKTTVNNKMKSQARTFLKREKTVVNYRTNKEATETLFANLCSENPEMDKEELLYKARKTALAQRIAYGIDGINYEDVLKFYIHDTVRGDNSDLDIKDLFKTIIESHYGVDLSNKPEEILRDLYNKKFKSSFKTLTQISKKIEKENQEEYKKVESVNYSIRGVERAANYKKEIETALKEEKVASVEIGKTSRRKREMDKALRHKSIEDKRNLLQAALRFRTKEERADIELMKAQFGPNPEAEEFINDPKVKALVNDDYRIFKVNEYTACVEQYIYAYKAATAMKTDNITNAAELYYIALTTKDGAMKRAITDRLIETHPDVFKVNPDIGLIDGSQKARDRFMEFLKKGKGKKFKDVETFEEFAKIELDFYKASVLEKINSELGRSKKEDYFQKEKVKEEKLVVSIKARVGEKEKELKEQKRQEFQVLNEKEELTEEEQATLRDNIRFIPQTSVVLNRGYVKSHPEMLEGVTTVFEKITDADRERRKEYAIEATIEQVIDTIKNNKITYLFYESHENTIVKTMAFLMENRDKYPEQYKEIVELADKVDPNLVQERSKGKAISPKALKEIYFVNNNRDIGSIHALSKLFEEDIKTLTEEIEISDISKEKDLEYGRIIQEIRNDPSLTIEERDAKIDAIIAEAKQTLREQRTQKAERKKEHEEEVLKIQEESNESPKSEEELLEEGEFGEIAEQSKPEVGAETPNINAISDAEIENIDNKTVVEVVDGSKEAKTISEAEGARLMKAGEPITIIGEKENVTVLVAGSETVSAEELLKKIGESEMVVGSQEQVKETSGESGKKTSSNAGTEVEDKNKIKPESGTSEIEDDLYI